MLLNVSSRNEVAPLFWQFYEAEMKKAGVHGSTLYVQSTSVSQAVLQTARDLQADVLVRGRGPSVTLPLPRVCLSPWWAPVGP